MLRQAAEALVDYFDGAAHFDDVLALRGGREKHPQS
jgi:hypothetical protein